MTDCKHPELQLEEDTVLHLLPSLQSWYECVLCEERFRTDLRPYAIEVHGGIEPVVEVPRRVEWAECQRCFWRGPIEDTAEGGACPKCGGVTGLTLPLKSRVEREGEHD